MKKAKRTRRARPNGHPLESYAISEAYRDAWYAVALARAEELMRDPELKERIEDSILNVLEGMVSRLRKSKSSRQ